MRPSLHVSSAIVVSAILHLMNIGDPQLFTIFILSSILIDLDFFIVPLREEKNHRKYLTHHPFPWIIILLVSILTRNNSILFIALGVLFHLSLDTIDFGLPLSPDLTTSWHLISVDESFESEDDFSRSYWGNKLILFIEICCYFLSVIVLLLVNHIFTIWVVFALIIASIYSGIELVKYRKQISR